MTEYLKEVLKSVLSGDTFIELEQNYDNWKNNSIFSVGIDSLAYVNLLIQLEDKYDLTTDEIDSISTLGDIDKLIERKELFNSIDLSAFPNELSWIIQQYMETSVPAEEVQQIPAKINLFKKLWLTGNNSYVNEQDINLNLEEIKDLKLDNLAEKVECLIKYLRTNKYNIKKLKAELIAGLATGFEVSEEKISSVNDYLKTKDYDILDLKNNSNVVFVEESEISKTYAVCHHCYGKKMDDTYEAVIASGKCYRKEETYDEFRLSEFEMVETIFFGDVNFIEKNKEKLLYLFFLVGESIGLDYRISIANDSFMSNNLEVILYQMLSKSKIELQIYSKKVDRFISIASINVHGSYFTKKFDVHDLSKNNSFLETMCVAFGLNRVVNLF